MPECTIASLAEQNPGFGLTGLNETQWKAAQIYFAVLELAAIGGTDYTNALTTTLIADANSLTDKMDRNMRQIALLNVARNNALAAGASVPETINDLNALTACCFQNADLDGIWLFLQCELGHHTGT